MNTVALSIALMVAGSQTLLAQSGTWTSATGGDYASASNWAGGTIAGGAGNTADMSTLDVVDYASIIVDSPITLGHLSFGDTNITTPGVWDMSTTNNSGIVLDNNGASPTITVGQLGVVEADGADDVILGYDNELDENDVLSVTGSSGFTKLGAGIITFGFDLSGLTGPININEGTVRIADTYGEASSPITMSNNTRLEQTNASGSTAFTDVTVEAGASATIQMLRGSNWLTDVRPAGAGATFNLETERDATTVTAQGDWLGAGGGFAVANLVNQEAADGPSWFRARFNRSGAPSGAMFASTEVNLTAFNLVYQTNSYGNNVELGALNGDAGSSLYGGHNGSGGSAPRYIIGGLNTDSNFAGTIVGNSAQGGISIEKVGTGTHTFSGMFDGDSLIASSTDIGRQGGVIRVTEGTLAFTDAIDSIPGGAGTDKSTVDVLAGAVLDVSGTDSTFSSSPLQQFQGSGTIVGDFNHDEGDIRPADVSTPDNDTTLTNVPIPTIGTITFDGNLAFNGGTVVFDMSETPGTDDLVQVTGSTSVSGGGIVDPNFMGAAPAPGETYTFLTSTGGFSDAVSGWTVNWPGRGAKPSVFIQGNDLKFTTTAVGASADLLWTGATNDAWDIEATVNWENINSSAAETFFQGDNVTFDDTGANVAVVLASAVSPNNMVIDSDTNNYSFSGASITATGTLLKSGASTVTFTEANTFTAAAVEDGVVELADIGGALGTGTLMLGAPGAGATINTTAAALTVNDIVLSGGDNVIRADSGAVFYPAALSGSGNLEFASDSTDLRLDIGGVDSALTGTITIGTDPDETEPAEGMWVRINGADNDFPNADVVLVDNAQVVNRAGSSTVTTIQLGSLTGEAGTLLTPFGGGGATPGTNWEIGNTGASTTFDGVIEDGGNGYPDSEIPAQGYVTKVGSGTLTLTGLNTYTGDTTVSGGTLSVTNAYLADTADVYMETGALFDLSFSGTDVIDSLFLDGVSQLTGIYGSSADMPAGADYYVDYLTGLGLLEVTTYVAPPVLPGDYNYDGIVNLADYTVWRDNLGAAEGTLGVNDTVGGAIGLDQYDLWKGNFGATAAAASLSDQANVPEPASAVVCLLLVTLGVAARRCSIK
ncbi:beta strand repeat-containing protein [Aeoliella mucimassa]|uniref:Autotransporter-associated beta strand repeat protein n=1 Tax=Aeoliella mucimassa TaxID=2527972 RepID=A0A518ALE3_9BACT|nr:autotransporter-associated beta strand repeat-containing protein [Aeoliella mucimassa]QDU55504.1 Autotransporter-associated beta strand repeat protein [Aeoliella mucimassa]